MLSSSLAPASRGACAAGLLPAGERDEVRVATQCREVGVVPHPAEILVTVRNPLPERGDGTLRLPEPGVETGTVVEDQRIIGAGLERFAPLAKGVM